MHILDGNAKDLMKECEEFEEKITQAGGVDLFIGGLCVINVYSGAPIPKHHDLHW